MDVDSIFGLFGFEKNHDKNLNKTKEELNSFKESPQFKIGMFKKMIWNGRSFKDQVLKFLKKSEEFIELESDVGEAGDYMMYTRSYFWVQECNLEDEEWQDAIEYYIDEEFIVCIKLCIKYFEEIEEFEKCAFLKKIQTYTEKQNFLNQLKDP
tara:strand:- start:2868 stop:3326 length:459 start_codon:yes stop_codon:yes gene_type:complete